MKRPFAACPPPAGAWFAALATLLAGGCGAHPVPLAARSGAQTSQGLSATLTTMPAPPHTGDDTLVLTLTDAATGAPVGDANVSATAQMLSPRLPGSPVTGRAQGNGVYQIPLRLGIATRYSVQVQAQQGTRPPATFTFALEAQQ